MQETNGIGYLQERKLGAWGTEVEGRLHTVSPSVPFEI